MSDTVLSTKGQLIVPANIRKKEKWKPGTKFKFVETAEGYIIIEIPKNPIKALSGLWKDSNLPEDTLKKMRLEDERLFRKKHFV